MAELFPQVLVGSFALGLLLVLLPQFGQDLRQKVKFLVDINQLLSLTLAYFPEVEQICLGRLMDQPFFS